MGETARDPAAGWSQDRRQEVASLLTEDPPPLIRRFLTAVGRGINAHRMIGDGDRVLVSLSGGKDSLAVALALRARLRFLPISYRLEALLVNWREHPHSAEHLTAIASYCDTLEIPLTIVDADMRPDSFGDRFDCYRCGRNRRRILFDHVRGWDGVPLIATGHHLDDIVQTTLMNLAFRGTFATMVPVQQFFDGAVRVIRPMCETREDMIARVVETLGLPVSTIDCPFRTRNVRTRIAPVVEELARINPRARENISRAHSRVDLAYLPPQKTDATE